MNSKEVLNQAIFYFVALGVEKYSIEVKKSGNVLMEGEFETKKTAMKLSIGYTKKKNNFILKIKEKERIQPKIKTELSVEQFKEKIDVIDKIKNILTEEEMKNQNKKSNKIFNNFKISKKMIEKYWELAERKDYKIEVDLKNGEVSINIKNTKYIKNEVFDIVDENKIEHEKEIIDFDGYQEKIKNMHKKHKREKEKRARERKIKIEKNKYIEYKKNAENGKIEFVFELIEMKEKFEGTISKTSSKTVIIKLEEGYEYGVFKGKEVIVVADNYSMKPLKIYKTNLELKKVLEDPLMFFEEYFDKKEEGSEFEGNFEMINSWDVKKMFVRTKEENQTRKSKTLKTTEKREHQEIKMMLEENGLWENCAA